MEAGYKGIVLQVKDMQGGQKELIYKYTQKSDTKSIVYSNDVVDAAQ